MSRNKWTIGAAAAAHPYPSVAAASSSSSTPLKPVDLANLHVVLTEQADQLIDQLQKRHQDPFTRSLPLGSNDTRLRLEEGLALHFQALNLVSSETQDPVSASDIIFEGICWSLVAETPQVFSQIQPQWLGEVVAQMVVWSCQHTQMSRTIWPSPEDWMQWRLRTASVIVQWFSDRSFADRAKVLQEVEGDLHSTTLQSAFDNMRVPPELEARKLHLLEARKEEAANQMRAMGEDFDPDKIDLSDMEAVEEMMGNMWCMDVENVTANFIRMAARLTVKVEGDNALVARFGPVLPMPRWTREAMRCVFRWIQQRCVIDLPDAHLRVFEEMATRACWPLGADTTKYRQRDTRDDVDVPYTVLQDEVGIDLTQMLSEDLQLPIGNASKDTQGLHFASLLFMLVNTLFSDAKLNWLQEYVILDPHTPSSRSRLSVAHRFGVTQMAPVIIWLQKTFCVLHFGHLTRCETATGALLLWLLLVREQHHSRLDNGEKVQAMVQQLLVECPIQS